MDCAIVPLPRHKELSLVQTVDFFYPLVDDPITMGKIAAANVVSDLFAMGVTEVDNLNLIVSSASSFTDQERDTILPLILQGSIEIAKMLKCKVMLKNSVINPWCIIGGTASSVCAPKEMILPFNAKHGDVLILTKPLGTQLATNAKIWMDKRHENYEHLMAEFSEQDITDTFNQAVVSMTTLNKIAASLMHKYDAHAATDITGFGLIGHAKNLADIQEETLEFRFHRLPFFKNILKFAKVLKMDKALITGKSVETSGGLLIALSRQNALEFCKEFKLICDGKQEAWLVGDVIQASENNASLTENPQLIEVHVSAGVL